MSVTPSIQSHLVQLLGRVLPSVRARRMFGEVGLYSGETFFALIADDVLYFKVDDATRGEYELRERSMSYFQVPEEILEDTDALREWAEQAVTSASRKRLKRRS
jgi:DNA transformation protein and related proteins